MAKLGDVAQIVSGQSPPGNTYNETGAGLPFFQGKAEFGERHPIPVKWCTAPTKVAEAGDILMSVRAPVGPTNVADRRCCIGRGLAAIRPIPGVAEPDYVLWALAAARPALEAKGNGSTFAAINRSDLASLDLPLPSLDEQRRIVDLLNRASAISRLAEAAQAKARDLIPALFVEMFGDPATNPRGWPVVGLSDAAAIRSGVTKGRKVSAAVKPVPYMRVANIQDGVLAMSEVKEIEITEDELRRFRLEAGDLLMTEGGDIDKLGRTAIWTGEIDPCIHQNHVFCVRLDRSRALSDYVATMASSSYGKAYFLKVAKRTTGIASINKTQLSQFPLLMPPLDLQREFAARVAEAKSQIAFAERAGRTAEALTQSIMAKVFAA